MADAPASMNSITSSAVLMPPMPITGMRTVFAASHTMRKAMGLIAGPDSPAVMLEMRGWRVSASMAMATKVFTSEMASAPASSAARATSGMLVTLGDSFTINGRVASFFDGADHVEQHARIAAERDASALGVGARDVELVGGDSFSFVECADHVLVLLLRVAEDVAEENDVFDLLQQRELFLEEGSHSNVLQADGVQHAGCSFKQPRRRIARHGLARESLDYEATDARERDDVLELDSVAEGAAGGDDRILQLDSRDRD